jgi:DNA-binding MarR family transcriptional regulator
VASYDSDVNNRTRKPSRPTGTGEALVFSLLGTAGAVEARLEAALSPVGLSLAKAGVLHSLAEAPRPVALSDLAKHQNCVRSNITQLIDRLEKEGLVRRRADPDDRRSVRAALTAAGRRAYARAMRLLAAEQRAIVSSLSPGDAASLRSALQVLAR